MTPDALNAALIKAHAAYDRLQLIALYKLAGDKREQDGDIDAACFYLTHAFVFALEEGADDAVALSQRLSAHGREVAL